MIALLWSIVNLQENDKIFSGENIPSFFYKKYLVSKKRTFKTYLEIMIGYIYKIKVKKVDILNGGCFYGKEKL